MQRIKDAVLLEVGAQLRRECRGNRFAFLELVKGSAFKKTDFSRMILKLTMSNPRFLCILDLNNGQLFLFAIFIKIDFDFYLTFVPE